MPTRTRPKTSRSAKHKSTSSHASRVITVSKAEYAKHIAKYQAAIAKGKIVVIKKGEKVVATLRSGNDFTQAERTELRQQIETAFSSDEVSVGARSE